MDGLMRRSFVWRWGMIMFLLGRVGFAVGDLETKVYLFSRNATSLELNFVGERISPLGDFNENNTVCAQQNTFVLPGNPLHSFQVIGLRDVFMQGAAVFANVPAKAEFPVYDEPTRNWYMWRNESVGPLLNASMYQEEMSRMSSVCYINGDMIPFIPLPDATILSRLSTAIIAVACAASLAALIGFVVNLRWVCKAQSAGSKTTAMFVLVTLLAVFSLALGAAAILGSYLVHSQTIAGFSTIANWGSMVAILFVVMIFLITRAEDLELLAEDSLMPHVLPWLVVFGLIFIAIPVVVFVPLRYILGPDDTSLYTLHFFVGTLFGEPEVINYNIQMMYCFNAAVDGLILLLLVVFAFKKCCCKGELTVRHYMKSLPYLKTYINGFCLVTILSRILTIVCYIAIAMFSAPFYARWILSMVQFTYIGSVFIMESIVLLKYDPFEVSEKMTGYDRIDDKLVGSKNTFGRQSPAIKCAVESRVFGGSGRVDASFGSHRVFEQESRLRVFDTVGSARRTVSLQRKPVLFKSRVA